MLVFGGGEEEGCCGREDAMRRELSSSRSSPRTTGTSHVASGFTSSSQPAYGRKARRYDGRCKARSAPCIEVESTILYSCFFAAGQDVLIADPTLVVAQAHHASPPRRLSDQASCALYPMTLQPTIDAFYEVLGCDHDHLPGRLDVSEAILVFPIPSSHHDAFREC